MAKFLYAYSGGTTAANEEERSARMQKWQTWLNGLGPALVDMGAPFAQSQSVHGKGGGKLTGYSIVEAGSLDEAVRLTKGLPILEDADGSVEVYEAISM